MVKSVRYYVQTTVRFCIIKVCGLSDDGLKEFSCTSYLIFTYSLPSATGLKAFLCYDQFFLDLHNYPFLCVPTAAYTPLDDKSCRTGKK
jgi:hypothetical protein